MTDRLKEIEERCEKSTPGPWVSDNEIVGWLGGDSPAVAVRYTRSIGGGYSLGSPVCMCQKDRAGRYQAGGTLHPIEDAEFIAHAREDIPYLLSVIKEKDEEIESLKSAVTWYSTS